MPDLTLRFSGLCGYVPRNPLTNSGTADNRLTVLMVRDEIGKDDPKTFHRPTLAIPVSAIDPSSPLPALLLEQDYELPATHSCHEPPRLDTAPKETYHLFDLNRYEVAVKGATVGNLLTIDSTPLGSNPPKTSGANGHSLRWMAPIEAIHPAAAEVKDAMFTANPPAEVAARVRLTDGEVKVACVDPMHELEIKNSTGQVLLPERPLAELVEYTKSFDQNADRTLILTPLDPGGIPHEIVFKQGRDVVCLINNIPAKKVLKPGISVGGRDKHFPNLYSLGKQPPSKANRGIPDKKAVTEGTIPADPAGVQNPQCPGGLFLPHVGA